MADGTKPLISVHIHRTAGTHFQHLLRKTLGNRVLFDYEHPPIRVDKPYGFDPLNCFRDNILERTNEGVENKDIVHGHFHAAKYQHLNVGYTTILRNPVDRVISHYLFAKESALWARKNYDFVEPIYAYTYDMDLSVVDFASIAAIKYFYTRTYFEEFDMNRFEIIGDYDEINNYLESLGERISADLISFYQSKPDQIYNEEQKKIMKDKKTIEKLHEILAEDMEFYNKWKGIGV